MIRRLCVALLLLLNCCTAMSGEQGVVASPLDLMPQPGDYTLQWWAEGFPGKVASSPWRRVIQTGYYALALDTDTLRIPHFGSLAAGQNYRQAAEADNIAWQSLPPAEITLKIIMGGKAYRSVAGGKWSQFAGPRLIESGRFFQRADVTDLVFTAGDGARLNGEARFEIAAWPDRLALILAVRPGPSSESWNDAVMEIELATAKGSLGQRRKIVGAWPNSDWKEAAIVLDPVSFQAEDAASRVAVRANEIPSGSARPVVYDAVRGWHQVDLDGIEPIVPPGEEPARRNDAVERVKLTLSNPSEREQAVRLQFEKSSHGIRQKIGAAITGVSAMLRDAQGNPTGIPVQLSKNWHNRPEGGVYAGQWFHGFSQVRLPAKTTIELELTIAYGHWGGVAAASHSQLCLIGWGSNQLWDESALGSWGESICYEPDQVQAECAILDVRPVMVRGMHRDAHWSWTHNVGGGDVFRLFDAVGQRIPHARMKTAYERYGPCLTEVTYAGRIGDGIEHTATVSLGRTDDIVRGVYRLRMDVKRPIDFSRLAIFQIGADTYSYTGERKMAMGNESGMVREWATQWGGNVYRTEPIACSGRIPWVSLHEAVPRLKADEQGAWANRGLVIRSWKARLGGKDTAAWIAEHGVKARGHDTSTVDIVPPPGVSRLEPGDFVEAVIEHLIAPQFAADYYGPNAGLRAALLQHQNTWHMISREAVENDRTIDVSTGTLDRLYPDVAVRATSDRAEFKLRGGLGYVPITFTGLRSPHGFHLLLDGRPVDQSVHGNDFWQTDFDPSSKTWSRTYNLPVRAGKTASIRLEHCP